MLISSSCYPLDIIWKEQVETTTRFLAIVPAFDLVPVPVQPGRYVLVHQLLSGCSILIIAASKALWRTPDSRLLDNE